MSFIETPRFPDEIAYGSSGGPRWSTTVRTVKSGKTYRNQNWLYPLHGYNVLAGIKNQADYETLRQWFYAMAGRAHGFRFKDFADYKTSAYSVAVTPTDQAIGTGDGVESDFQMIKTYTIGTLTGTRKIVKPVSGTWTVAVAGATAATGDYSVATGTGIITFATGAIPATGAAVTAGFEFDVPVEFGKDIFDVSIIDCNSTTSSFLMDSDSFPLTELRL
jgi:uncharacterized protein (TIGR02217 family)